MKNIEWVISEIEQRVEKVEDHEKTAAYNKGVARGLGISLFLIDQLDEPEALSQDGVDRAYKDGYEKGKQHTFYKGYLEGLADKESEPETVADVIADFCKSLERLKEALGTEVKELEE